MLVLPEGALLEIGCKTVPFGFSKGISVFGYAIDKTSLWSKASLIFSTLKLQCACDRMCSLCFDFARVLVVPS